MENPLESPQRKRRDTPMKLLKIMIIHQEMGRFAELPVQGVAGRTLPWKMNTWRPRESPEFRRSFFSGGWRNDEEMKTNVPISNKQKAPTIPFNPCTPWQMPNQSPTVLFRSWSVLCLVFPELLTAWNNKGRAKPECRKKTRWTILVWKNAMENKNCDKTKKNAINDFAKLRRTHSLVLF